MSQAFNLTAQINLQAPSNLKTVVAQIRRELGTVSADVKINISGQSARTIDNITRRLDAMNAALIQARTNTSSLDTALRSLNASFSSLQSSSSKTTSSIANTTNTVKQTAKSLQVVTTEMEEFGKQSALAIRRFAAFSVVTTGVFALTNAITSGFKAFVEFDQELVKLQQVTGKGVVGLRGLEKEITVLATSLGVSSKSLVEVASTLAQAGLSAEDTRVALSALAKTELAPSFDSLTDTTEGAIAALRQFGLQAKDLEKALGSINAVAAAFAVESKDIIAAIQRTGGVFAAASRGVSEGTDALNEFVAVFTSVRATTRESAETIATGLRTIFTRLQRAKTIDQLKEFGVELTDLEGKFVGPFEAVKRLSQALNQLDPRDLRFSSIVEELGGFRQIGKVIPLIQQFATAQEALKVAQKGQGSLTEAQITAQKSLANQLAKVREQFLALIRDVGKSQTFQGLFKVVTSLASGLISLAGAFKPILPILAIMGAVKGVSAITQFASGFAGGIKKGGGAGSVGTNIGESLSGAKDKEKSDTQQRANTLISENTSAIKTLTTVMNSLMSNIADNTRALASSNSQALNSGGVVKKFARGGLVPGSGNGDTVPAMLEPGEFVIRKKAVESLGSQNLHKINKYAGGGIVDESTIGVAVLDAKNEINGSDQYTIKKGDFPKYATTTDRGKGLNYLPKGRGYTVVRETLDDTLKPLFNKAIDTGIVSGLERSLEELGNEYKIPLPLSSNSAQAFLKGINDATRGNVFESMLTALSTDGNFDPSADPQAPFDYVGGFQGKLASSKLFQKIKGLNYIDAKASEEQSREKNIAPKILLQLFKENNAMSGAGTDIGSRVLELLQNAKPNQSFSLDEIRSSVKGANSSTLEKLVEDGIIKKTGRYYQKLALGGVAKAPLVDDMLENAKGSVLPSKLALEQLIETGYGALDFDRTLKRTIGDAAYSKAKTPSEKDEVLNRYFRDSRARLEDVKSAKLTKFGSQLQKLIEKGVIKPTNLSIISKSKRVPGLAEHIQELFGIPLANMIFTSGGSKEPALEAMRTKGPRATRVMKSLGGIISQFALGGRVYDLQKGTGLNNSEFDSLVKYGNTNDFTEKEFKDYLETYLQRKKSKKDLMMNSSQLLDVLRSGTRTPQPTQSQTDLARQLMGAPDAQYNPRYDNVRKPFATGGSVEDTVPALLTPGEFVINKKAAQKIGYSQLHRMNKADKIQGYNSGGIVGNIQRFFVGGVAEKQAARAQGSVIMDIKQAEKTFAMTLGPLAKEIRDKILSTFKGIEKIGAGGRTSLGTVFTENTRGQAAFGTQKGKSVSLMGLQIGGNKVQATTETVAHETGHLADQALGGGGDFASRTEGTFQFELVEKVKPIMIKAFEKAGESSKKIENYLSSNAELFAEFFAKASPQVRAIITSTTNAKDGMKALADHLGEAGYTYAGLEASDIDSSLPKKSGSGSTSSVNKTLGSMTAQVSALFSGIKSKIFGAGAAPPSGGGGNPPIDPWPVDLMPFTTAVKVATEAQRNAAEEAKHFAAKIKESGQSAAGFAKTLAAKVVNRSNTIIDDLPNKKQDLTLSAISVKGKLNNQEAFDNALTNFSNKLRDINPEAAQDTINKAAKDLADAMKIGDSFEKVANNSAELSDILKKTYTEAEATEKAFKDLADETGLTADQLKKLIGPDNLRRQQFVQSEQGQRFGKLASIAPDMVQRFANTGAGAALGKAADFASGKGLVASVSKKFGDDIGKSLDKWLGRFGGPMGVLGAGLAILGDQLPKVIESLGMGSSTTAAAAVGGIKGAGQGLASGAVLGAQVAGPVGALIGGITGAVVSGISGAFEAYNDKKLENNLRALDKASSDLEIAFKKLDASASEANFTDAQLKFNATVGSISDVAKQANLGASGIGRAITETLRGLDPTGLISSVTGEKQEGESRQATINAVTKAIGDADKLGSVRLNKVSTSSITDFLDSVPALPERLKGEKDVDYENRNRGVLNERRTQLARANQGYQTLKDSGMSEEAIFLSRYTASQQQAGKTPAEISNELGDPKKREEAIQKGKELLAVEGELALKQAVLSRSSKDLAVATEQLLDVYRRAQAGLDRYGAELAEFESLSLSRVADLTGNASVQQPNRSSERVLGNISAYSMDEVRKVADETSRLAGGGDAGNKLKNDVITAKILRDELPKALRNTSGNNVDDVIDQLEEGFKNAGVDFSDSLRTQLTENLESKTAGRQNVGLSDLADDSSILDNLLKGTEAGLKFAQDIQAKYNDTISVAANLMNKYNDVLSEAEENQRKAVDIRLNAELDLAKALGRSPTLKELNNPIDTEIKGLTQSVIPGGTTDPAKIAAELQNIDKSIAAGEARLKNPTLETYGAKNQAELDDAIGKDIQALGKQKKALNDGTKALEKLANDGTKAANALSKIQARQQTSQNAVNIAQKLLTSDETELADFTRQMQAYTKTIGGGASQQELGSLQFRRDAFGGLENIKSVLPDNIAKQMQATLTRQMLSANPEGNRILQQQVGIDEDGNALTLDQALSNVEGGKLDPVQQQQIEAYNTAVQAQVDAANALGDRAVQAADILSMNIEQLMGNLGDGVNGIISNLQNILPEAQAAAQGEPKPEVKAEDPTGTLDTASAGAGSITIPGLDAFPEASKANTDAILASVLAMAELMAAIFILKKAFEMFNGGGSGGIRDRLTDMFSGGSRRKRRRRGSRSKRGSSTRTKSSSDKGKSSSKSRRKSRTKTTGATPTPKPRVSARGSRGKRRGGGILGTLFGMFGSEAAAGLLPENMQDAAYGVMDTADVALNVKDAAQAAKTARSGVGAVRGGVAAVRAGAGAVGTAAAPLLAANSAVSIIDNAVQAAYDPAAYDANMRAKADAGAQRAAERETYGQLAGDSLGGAVQGLVDPAGKIVEGVYTGAGAVSDIGSAISGSASVARQEREYQSKNKFNLTHTQFAQAQDEANARLALKEAQKNNDNEAINLAQNRLDGLQKVKIGSGARIDNWFTDDQDTANYSKAVEELMAQKTASVVPQTEPATEQIKSATEASTAIQTMSKAALGFATIIGSGLLTGTPGKTTEGSATPATSGIMDTVMGFVKSGAGSGATSSLGQLLSSIGLGDSLNKNDSSKPIYMDVLQKIADNLSGNKTKTDSSKSSAMEELRNANKAFIEARSKIEGAGTAAQMGTPEDLDAFKAAEERLNKAKLAIQSFGSMTSNGGDPGLNMSPGFITAANAAAQSHPAPDAKIERKDGKLHVGNKPYEYSNPTSADPSSLTSMATGTQTSVQAVEAALPQFNKEQQKRLTSLTARGKARASDDGFRIGRTPEQEAEYQELRKLKLDSDPALKNKLRLGELGRKGKLRAGSDGLPTGRSPEEEQEYKTLVANKPKTPYEQMQLSKREAYLSRLNPETRAIMEKKLGISSQDNQNPMTAPPVSTGPVPTSLSTQQVVNDRTSGTPGDRMAADQTGSGYTITIDESSRQFLEAFSVTLNSFGSYIDKLSAIQLPDSITMKGEHVVDVRISGAAAFEGLKKDFMNMMQVEISNKMAMIWKQTGGKVGEAPTNTVDSNAGSIGQGMA